MMHFAMMRFETLATDFDGTFADNGVVEPSTLVAMQRLRASGRHAVMVTGRQIEDLHSVFSRTDLFDVIVAENGGVLYTPATKQFQSLHAPPPAKLVEQLQARRVLPLAVGHVIVATTVPNETIVLTAIRDLGLELKIVFNKGAVMIVPTGVNKVTGLAAALKLIEGSLEKTVGIGDAENDHAFLEACGCAVAVANALPSLKEHADFVTSNSAGRGVSELIEMLLKTDLKEVPLRTALT